MATESDHRQSDLAVMDIGEYKQKRRLQRILDAHDNVEAINDEALEAHIRSTLDQDGKDILLLNALQQFIRECENLLREHAETMHEAGEPDLYWTGVEEYPIGEIEFSTGRVITFYGLQDMKHAQFVYLEEKEVEQDRRHGPPTVETEWESKAVPENVTLSAYSRLNRFLGAERNIDLSFEAEDFEAEEPGL